MALKGVSEERIPELRVFGFEAESGLQRVPLSHKIAWKLRLPDPMGRRGWDALPMGMGCVRCRHGSE